MPGRGYSHVVGFDDAPFERSTRGDVPVIGAVFAGLRLEGVLRGKVRRDGVNATRSLISLITRSKFYPQLQLVLLQGIAFAGFNVVDLDTLHRTIALPVMVVSRRRPRFGKIRRALDAVPGGDKKWALIARAGPMHQLASVYVQLRGIEPVAADRVIRDLAVHGHMPEPLRVAHLIAGGLQTGQSRGRT